MNFENEFSTAVRAFFPNNIVSSDSTFKFNVFYHFDYLSLKSSAFLFMFLAALEDWLKDLMAFMLDLADAVVGDDVVIGENVWITFCVASSTKITIAPPVLKYKKKMHP